jgi:hypothetical protein
MKIAILGWGSLLWEDHPEFGKQHEPKWEEDGPILKIEFCRISESRLGALTLVIDNEHGVATRVAWSLSKRKTAEDAICDLRCREGTVLENIKHVAATPPGNVSNLCPVEEIILAWAQKQELNRVIWTGLESNFTDKTGKPFSVDAAVDYVKKLSPEAKAKAAEYIWRTPNFVKTPVRSALQWEPWFSESAPILIPGNPENPGAR